MREPLLEHYTELYWTVGKIGYVSVGRTVIRPAAVFFLLHRNDEIAHFVALDYITPGERRCALHAQSFN